MNTVAAIFQAVDIVLQLLSFILFVYVIVSLLISFNVLNMRSQAVRQISYTLDRVTAPLLNPIRRVLPEMGGIDFSPFVLWLIIYLLRAGILPDLARLALSA